MKPCSPPALATSFSPGRWRQVVGVREQDLGAGVREMERADRTHRGLGTDRHVDRRSHGAMGKDESGGARGTIRRVNGERGLAHPPSSPGRSDSAPGSGYIADR